MVDDAVGGGVGGDGRPQRCERLAALVIVEAFEHPAQQPERERVRVVCANAEPHRRQDGGDVTAGEPGSSQSLAYPAGVGEGERPGRLGRRRGQVPAGSRARPR